MAVSFIGGGNQSARKKKTYDIKLNKLKKQILKFSYAINAYHH
jgi:hypothetical protein